MTTATNPLGERIRAARTAAGLTQYELAVQIGVMPSTANRWEKGKSAPRVRQARLLSELLGLPVTHFQPEPPASPEHFTLEDLARAFQSALQGAKSESAQRWADRRHKDRRRENVAVDRDRRRGERRALVAA